MSELEQTIEELEAEVLAELEEAQHAKSDPQMKGAAPAEGKRRSIRSHQAEKSKMVVNL